MTTIQTVHSAYIQQLAITHISHAGQNKMRWDFCQPIWNSRDLVADSSSPKDQMAVFGARGKVETPEKDLCEFRICHDFDFSRQTYQLQVLLSGHSGCSDEVLDIKVADLPFNGDFDYFRSSVIDLTEKFSRLGREKALRDFLMAPIGDAK